MWSLVPLGKSLGFSSEYVICQLKSNRGTSISVYVRRWGIRAPKGDRKVLFPAIRRETRSGFPRVPPTKVWPLKSMIGCGLSCCSNLRRSSSIGKAEAPNADDAKLLISGDLNSSIRVCGLFGAGSAMSDRI
jgi:hypothetical protein